MSELFPQKGAVLPALINQGEQNLTLLQSLIPSNESFYICCYAPEGHLIAASCPSGIRETLDHAFRSLGGHDKMLGFVASGDHSAPRLIGSSIGLEWAAVFEMDRNRNLVFVVGPVFNAQVDGPAIRNALLAEADFTTGMDWIEPLCALAPLLPVMSYAVFAR